MAVFSAVIQTVPDHKRVGNGEANVVRALQSVWHTTSRFVQQHARTHGRAFETFADGLERSSGIKNVVYQQHRLSAKIWERLDLDLAAAGGAIAVTGCSYEMKTQVGQGDAAHQIGNKTVRAIQQREHDDGLSIMIAGDFFPQFAHPTLDYTGA
jgi:hypothetical protein